MNTLSDYPASELETLKRFVMDGRCSTLEEYKLKIKWVALLGEAIKDARFEQEKLPQDQFKTNN